MKKVIFLLQLLVLVSYFLVFVSAGCSKSGRRLERQEAEENNDDIKIKKEKENELNKVIIEKDDDTEENDNNDEEKKTRRKVLVKRDENNNEYVEIPMFKTKSGIYEVPIRINGLELDFVFDTGASDISISELEFQLLTKKRRIKQSDIKEQITYKDASGNTLTAKKITLRQVEVGNKILRDVDAIVINNARAPLLLGQSALSRFGRVEIDYQSNAIRLF